MEWIWDLMWHANWGNWKKNWKTVKLTYVKLPWSKTGSFTYQMTSKIQSQFVLYMHGPFSVLQQQTLSKVFHRSCVPVVCCWRTPPVGTLDFRLSRWLWVGLSGEGCVFFFQKRMQIVHISGSKLVGFYRTVTFKKTKKKKHKRATVAKWICWEWNE